MHLIPFGRSSICQDGPGFMTKLKKPWLQLVGDKCHIEMICNGINGVFLASYCWRKDRAIFYVTLIPNDHRSKRGSMPPATAARVPRDALGHLGGNGAIPQELPQRLLLGNSIETLMLDTSGIIWMPQMSTLSI